MSGAYSALGPFRPQIKPLFAIYPIYSLVVYLPAFTPKKNVYTSISIPDSGSGKLFYPHTERSLQTFPGTVVIAGSI
jgi:hypothetical protein